MATDETNQPDAERRSAPEPAEREPKVTALRPDFAGRIGAVRRQPAAGDSAAVPEPAPAAPEPAAAERELAARERRLAELSEALAERSESLVAEVAEAERAMGTIAGFLRRVADAVERPEPSHEPAPAISVAARQVAFVMASGGVERAVVGAHLAAAFPVADPTELLDQIYGPGTGPDARAPWAIPPA